MVGRGVTLVLPYHCTLGLQLLHIHPNILPLCLQNFKVHWFILVFDCSSIFLACCVDRWICEPRRRDWAKRVVSKYGHTMFLDHHHHEQKFLPRRNLILHRSFLFIGTGYVRTLTLEG